MNPQVVTRDVEGTASSSALLVISHGPTYDYGNRAVGSSTDHTFTIENTGDVSATTITPLALSAPFSYKGGSYPGTGGTCGAFLNSLATCSLVVTYSPSTTGTHTDTISIDYFDGVVTTNTQRDVTGIGSAPAVINISNGPTYNFGTVALGGNAEHSFTVSNTGGVPSTGMSGGGLAAPFNFKGGTYPGTGGTCGATLSNGTDCTVVVVYTPTVAASHSDTLTISYNNGVTAGQTSDRDVEGTGVLAAFLTISDGPSYNYGTLAIGRSADRTFTVSNTGGESATSVAGGGLAAPFSFKGGSYPGTGGNCSASLAASANCTIVVTYTPTVVGVHSDTIEMSYNSGLGPQVANRDVEGAGDTPAVLTISDGPTYNFGNLAIGQVAEHAFTVSNTGGVPATSILVDTLSAPFSFKGGTYPGTGGTCGATILGLTDCTVVVTFSPLTTGVHNENLAFTYNDGITSQSVDRDITGSSADLAVITISDATIYNFGIQPLGSTTDHTFTLNNSGGISATAMAGTGLALPFSFKGGSYPGTAGTCGASLAAATTCTIVVSYSPMSTGLHSDTIEIQYNNGSSVVVADRDVEGTGASAGFLEISEAPFYDFGTRATGSTTDHTFVVTNTGSLSTTAMAGSGLDAPFSFKGGAYPGTGGTCAGSLAPSANCSIVVTYAPVANGIHSDTILIDYNDGLNPGQAARNVEAAAASPALITISNSPVYDYGTQAVGASVDHSFTISNTGGVPATSISQNAMAIPFSYKGGSYPGTGGNCGTNLAPGASCSVIITYSPVATGLQSQNFQLDYNDGVTTQSELISIQGTGADLAFLTITDGPLFDFGSQALGSSTDHTFTVANTGGVTATSVVGSGLVPPFTFKGGSYPGTGGTCGATINAAANCTIVVNYSPTTLGLHVDTVVIDFNNGVGTQNAQRDVAGTGANPALLTISDGPTYDFGTVAVNSLNEHAFTIENTGSLTATAIVGSGLALPFEFKGGNYPGTGGTCGATIAAGATCSVVVSYNPTSTGVHTDTLNIDYNNGVGTVSVSRNIQGTATTPALLTISDSPLFDYGNRALGSTTDKTFTVVNSGGVAANSIAGTGLASPFEFKGGSYPGTGGTCGADLAAGSNCSLVVSFTPSVAILHTDTIELNYNDGASPQQSTRDIQGTGSSSALLVISHGPTYDFGPLTVGSSVDHTFTIENTGSVTASAIAGSGLDSPFNFKGGSYPGSGGTCGATLPASGTCSIVVTYSPLTTGTHSDTILIDYNDGAVGKQSTRNITGQGLGAAVIVISNSPLYDYGTRANGSATDFTFTVENTGASPATAMAGTGLANPFSFKGGNYPGAGGNCGATLAASTTCNIVVTYAPTTTGLHTDTIEIDYFDGALPQQSPRNIQGTGVIAANLVISEAPYFDFGIKALGSSTDHTFTIENTGGASATAMAGGVLSAPFSFKGGNYPGTGGTCSASLSDGAQCTIVATYSPTAVGIHSQTLNINYENGAGAAVASRDVQGTGANPAVITISDNPLYDFGSVTVNAIAEHTFTIENTGGVSATSLVGSGLAAPYNFKGGTYPGTDGTCSNSLNAAATCTVVVVFNPTIVGTHNDTLDMSYHNGVSPQLSGRNITGVATTPAILTITDSPEYDFGTRPLGSNTDYTLTISNTGGSSATTVVGTGLAAPFSFKDGSYPGTGGTCGATINASSNCSIVVTYSPTTSAIHTDTIEINYFDGIASQQASRDLRGQGASAAFLAISEVDPYSYGTRARDSSIDHTFVITNTGALPSSSMAGSGLAAPFSFKGGSYPGTGGTCAGGLAAAATCTIIVNYAPTANGFHNDTIEMDYFNGLVSAQSTRMVQGTAADPALLTLSEAPTYDYGIKGVGSTTDHTFTMNNSGGVTAELISDAGGLALPFNFKGGSYPGTGGTCGVSLPAAGSCTVVVSYAPAGTGVHNDVIEINYENGASSQVTTRAVTGTGANLAFLTISNGPLFDFGTRSIGSSTDQSFTITNTGGVSASAMAGSGLISPFSFKGGSYPGTGGNCSDSLTPAATCTIVVTYSPVAAGIHNDTIEIQYNNSDGVQLASGDVTGTGANAALLTISDGPVYDFGVVASGGFADHTFTVENIGGVTATGVVDAAVLAPPFTFKGGTFPGTGGSCGSNLNSGAQCTIVVSYSPAATGSHNDTIQLNYNDGVGSTNTQRDVQGTATAPALITISETNPYDFGSQALGSTAQHTFTLSNTGGVAATTVAGVGLAAPFSFKDGSYPGTGGSCGVTLNNGSNCTIVVTYTPATAAVHNDTIEINYFDGATAQTSNRDVTGTGTTSAFLVISQAPVYDFESKPVGSSTDFTFTLENTGSVTASTISGTGLASPFSFKGGTFPGTGGTCGATLAPSGTCNFIVTYSPLTTGAHVDTIEINYNNGATLDTATRNLQGLGVNPAVLTLSDSPTYNFGERTTGSTQDATLTLSNSGGYAASDIAGSGLAAPFSFKGGSFPGSGGTCGVSLTAGANCTVVITYAPATVAVHNDTVVIDYNDGVVAQSTDRDLTGTGVIGAFLTISDAATYNFGVQAQGSSTDHTFTIENTGGAVATAMSNGVLLAPFSFKGGSYPGTGGNCGASLNAGLQCTVVVSFSPASTGLFSNTLSINYNNGSGAAVANRDIEGTGAAPALLTVSDGPTFDFGNVAVNSSTDHTFTLENTGGVPASVITGTGLAAPYSFKGGTFPGTDGTCTGSLAAAATCTFVVTFNPTITGTQTDTIEINYNNGASTQQSTRDLTGVATTPAILTLSNAPSYDFGIQPLGSLNDFSFTINNSGGAAATSISGAGLAAPFSFKDGTYPGTGGTCGVSLAAGSNCSIIVTFSPSSAGSFSDTIEINYNDGVTTQQATRDVLGEGAAAAFLTITESPYYDYGIRALTSNTDHTFTITNTGALAATSLAGTGLNSPFSFKGGSYPGTDGTCGVSLASSGTCTIVVTYSPSVVGNHFDTILIDYNDGLVAQQAQRNVQGIGANPADLLISDGPTYDYGTKGVGSINEHTFTMTNNGGVPSTLMSPVALALPFKYKGGSYPGTGGNCGVTLAAAATCEMVVVYEPTSTGAHTGNIRINYNNGAASVNSQRALEGLGANLAFLAISNGPTFNYGTRSLGSSTDQSFTVENTGGVAATSVNGTGLALPFSFKGGSYPGTGGNCGSTINPSATCTIVVTYSPTLSGTHNGTIQIDYDDGDTVISALRDVTGIGAPAAFLTLSDAPLYDYGLRAVGANADHTFTLENTGGVTATAISPAAMAGPFDFKGGAFPGTGGSCGNSLNPGANCTLVVTYSPLTTGSHNSNILLNYNDGTLNPATVDRDVQGTATTPALLTLSDGPTYNFGTRALGSSTDYTFTVSNDGGVAATTLAGVGLASPFEFKGGSYPGVGGTCSTDLPSGNNCTIRVTYSPSTAAVHNDTIEINYFDGASPQTSTRDVTGTGSPTAFLAISDGPTYDFTTRAVGSTTEFTFTVTNTGAVTATSMAGYGLAAPFLFKGGSYPGTGGTCDTTLVASGTCTVIVTYSPVSTGLHNDAVNIDYNNGAVPDTASVSVTGLGVNPAVIDISNSPVYNFGTQAVGSTGETSLTLTNNGGFEASGMAGSGLAAPYSFKGGSYPGSGGTCGTSLGVGLNCTVVITYMPSTVATHNDTLLIDYNDGASSQQSERDLTGQGVVAAFLEISDAATFDYGTVARGAFKDHTFTITNTGGAPATAMADGLGLAAPFNFKGGSYPGTSGTCGASLGVSGTCQVVVTYSPTANGIHSDTLTINYEDGTGPAIASRGVQGIAADPAILDISHGPTYDFGTVTTGGEEEHNLTITNNGGVLATGILGTGLGLPFAFKGGSFPGAGGTCANSLPASANCSVVVTFSPFTTGVQTDTLILNYNDGVGAASSQRDLTGTGVNPAFLTISESDPYDFGDQALGSTTEHTFTISNTGGAEASTMSGGGLSAPFSYKGGAYPGTGGTCGVNLSASSNCTVIVTFTPTAMGVHSRQITINYNDGGANQQALRTVTGNGAGAAELTISDGPIYDYGLQAVGSNTDHTFIITNNGSVTANSMSGDPIAAPFNYKGGSYPGTGGTCDETLDSGLTCTVVVTYSPFEVGTGQVANLVVRYNDGALPQSAARIIRGDADIPAVLAITAPSLPHNYGTRGVTSVNDQTYTLVNSGGVPARNIQEIGLANPYSLKGGTWPGSGGNCGETLAPGANCNFVVSFSPVAVGTFNDTIEVQYNDGVTSQTGSGGVTGIGATLATLVISDATTFDFGTKAVGSVTQHTFNVDNIGGVPATGMVGSGLSTPYRFKGGSYPGTDGTCNTELPASGTCTIVVEFAPISTGSFNDSVQLDYSDSVNSQVALRDVTGVGASTATLTISEANPYNFGTHAVGSVTEHTFVVTNTGGVEAEEIVSEVISAPFRYKGGAYPGTNGTCGVSLAPLNTTCNLVVEYAPTAAGSHNSTIQLNYNNGASTQSVSRDIQGSSTTPAVILISHGATYNFGTHAVSSTAEHTFTLTNNGQTTATLMLAEELSLPFAFKGGTYPGTNGTCGTELNASDTCDVVVTFNPTSTGSFGDTLQVNYFNGASNQSATRPMTGEGGNAASLEISHSPDYDFGVRAIASNTDHTFTITNNGAVQATTLNAIAFSEPVFTFKDGSYPGTGGTCGTELDAAATCTIIVTFSPIDTSTSNDVVQLSYFDGVSSQTASRVISGTGATAADLIISDGPTYNFGTRARNSSTYKTFTVENVGAVAATSMNGTGLGVSFNYYGGSYPGTGGTCGVSLAAGATCEIVIRFWPTTTGTKTETMSVNYNNGATAVSSTRQMTGISVSNALLTISNGATFDFGTRARGSISEHEFTVTNTGGWEATLVASNSLTAPYRFKGGTFPGTDGTCTATIASTANCTVVVEFAPTANGTFNNTLTINYQNGADSGDSNSSRAITGIGADPALLTISEANPYNYGTRALASNTPHLFTITNTGGVPATSVSEIGLVSPFNFNGGVFPGTNGTCTTTINNGTSCEIEISFSPSSTGSFADSIEISYHNGVNTQSVLRNVEGAGANEANLVWIDAPSYDFGGVAVGTGINHKFTVQNVGGVAATSLNLTFATPHFTYANGSYPGSDSSGAGVGTCGATLNPGTSCDLIIRFAPQAAFPISYTAAFVYNNGVTTTQSDMDLLGEGEALAYLIISEGTYYSYGTRALDSSTDHTFTISNIGTVSATNLGGTGLNAPYSFKGGTFPGTGGTCVNGGSLGPDPATCTIVVTFAPTVTGSYTDHIRIEYHDGNSNRAVQREVRGVGATQGLLTFSNQNFGIVARGSVTATSYRIVSNIGGVPVTDMSSVLNAPFAYKGGGAYPGVDGDCGLTLNEGASCNIYYQFAPTVNGYASTDLEIYYHDGANNVMTSRLLEGTAVDPAVISIDVAPEYDFGDKPTNSQTDVFIQLTNNGQVPATALGGFGMGSGFTYAGSGFFPGGGTCGTSLDVATSCTVGIRFAPTADQSYFNPVFAISYNNGANSTTAPLQLRGRGVGPANLEYRINLSTTITNHNFGTVAIGNAITFVTVYLYNTGSTAASSIAPVALSSPFKFFGGSYPGSGGNCGTDLNEVSVNPFYCTLILQYEPTATGNHNETLTINYHNGVQARTANLPLSGVGADPALVTISEIDPYDYGTLQVGDSANHVFVLENTGGVPAASMQPPTLTPPYQYNGGTYPGTGGNCGGSLAAGATCNLDIVFVPTIAGDFDSSFTVIYDNGVQGASATRNITGRATSPAIIQISLSDPYNFGPQPIYSDTEVVFTLQNVGSLQATGVTGFALTAPFKYSGAGSYPGGGNCTNTLNPGQNCNVRITFNPTAEGSFTDTFTVSYHDGSTTQTTTKDLEGSTMVSEYCVGKTGNSPYAGGAGTSGNPYTLCTPAQFLAMASNLGSYFELRDNIDFTGTSFTPIGNSSSAFTGTFDGKGFEVRSITYSNASQDDIGVFGVSSGTIKNLTVTSIDLTARDHVGGIIGRMTGGSLLYSSSGGAVSGSNTNTANGVGGAVGTLTSGTVDHTYSTANVAGNYNVGGFVGHSSGTITKAYTSGAVSGNNDKAGGFVGLLNSGSITDSYAQGGVDGSSKVGGFAGETLATSTRSYSRGNVTGSSSVGGYAGSASGSTETNCYWNTQTSNQGTSAGSATGMNTSNMRDASNFTNWNFNGTWKMEGNQPLLSHFSSSELFTPASFIFAETFEGAGTVETWNTPVVTSGNSYNVDSTSYISSFSPNWWGTQSLRVTTDSGSSNDSAYNTRTLSPTQNRSWISFDVALTALTTLSDEVSLVTATNSAGTAIAWEALVIEHTPGTHRFQFDIWYDGTRQSITWPSSGGISLDQVYRVEVKWDITNRRYTLRVNKNTVSTGALTGTATGLSIAQVVAGSSYGSSSTATFDLDNLRISVPMVPAAMTQNMESIITLTHTGSPDSCEIMNLHNVTMTTPCACIGGVCKVGVRGFNNFIGTGSFDYTVKKDGHTSNASSTHLTIN